MKTPLLVASLLAAVATRLPAQETAQPPAPAAPVVVTEQIDATRAALTQAEAAYDAALQQATGGQLTDLDARIAQARAALTALMIERQRLMREAERSIAPVANARDRARDAHLAAVRAQMAARRGSDQ